MPIIVTLSEPYLCWHTEVCVYVKEYAFVWCLII